MQKQYFRAEFMCIWYEKKNSSDVRNRILWTPTPTFFSEWVEKRAVVNRTQISHKHSDSEGVSFLETHFV
jgi:hypothetical protein